LDERAMRVGEPTHVPLRNHSLLITARSTSRQRIAAARLEPAQRLSMIPNK
jgi:hypothetical protein